MSMAYSYKTYSEIRDVMKKFVNCTEGSIIYGMGRNTFQAHAEKAGAIYRVGDTILVNTEIFEKYLQQFKENPKPMPSYTEQIMKLKEFKGQKVAKKSEK